jgi:hypothetical protein
MRNVSRARSLAPKFEPMFGWADWIAVGFVLGTIFSVTLAIAAVG